MGEEGTDSDSYRYGFNADSGSNSSTPSPTAAGSPSSIGVDSGGGRGLSDYKPSMLSPFDNFHAPGFSGSLDLDSPTEENDSEGTNRDTEEKVDGNSTDYYSSLNADTAALLW